MGEGAPEGRMRGYDADARNTAPATCLPGSWAEYSLSTSTVTPHPSPDREKDAPDASEFQIDWPLFSLVLHHDQYFGQVVIPAGKAAVPFTSFHRAPH